jgi:hypothetical protein
MQEIITTVAYARFNIQLKTSNNVEQEVATLQELLYDAAIWGGADDVEVFFSKKNYVVGVSIPVEEDIATNLGRE